MYKSEYVFAGQTIRITGNVCAGELYFRVGYVITALLVPRPKEKGFNGIRADSHRIHCTDHLDTRRVVSHYGRAIVDKYVVRVDHIFCP